MTQDLYVTIFNGSKLPDVVFVDTSIPYEEIEDAVIEIVAAVADGDVTIVPGINNDDWNPYYDDDDAVYV